MTCCEKKRGLLILIEFGRMTDWSQSPNEAHMYIDSARSMQNATQKPGMRQPLLPKVYTDESKNRNHKSSMCNKFSESKECCRSPPDFCLTCMYVFLIHLKLFKRPLEAMRRMITRTESTTH